MRATTHQAKATQYLIVTADDFGLHESINDAIEKASYAGILTTASLMVSGPAAGDAIRRAQRLAHLRVGLHLVLADGWPQLSPAEIPALVNDDGYLDESMVQRGVAIFARRAVKRQAEAEIRAQLQAFRRTGLTLDHVNAHKHFHCHPTILSILLSLAAEFGIRAIRVPREPFWFARAHGNSASIFGAAAMSMLAESMRYRIRAAGMFCNDQVFGIANSGGMDETSMLNVLARLPPGITEIYLHPATELAGPVTPSMATYRHGAELAALLSPRVRAALDASGVRRGGFGDIFSEATAPTAVCSGQ